MKLSIDWVILMNERDRFLQVNPEIAELLKNDSSLKWICSKEVIQSINTNSLRLPVLYLPNDIQFNINNFTVDNYMRFLLSLVVGNKLQGEILYRNCCFTVEDVEEISKMIQKSFELVRTQFIEYFSGLLGIEVKTEMSLMGDMVVALTIRVKFQEHYHGALKDTFDFLKLCGYVVQELGNQGKLRANYSKYTVAAILYNWVVLHTSYDTTYKKYAFTGFSALKYGYAVCQGFTALYNALCKLCGINIVGMAGLGKPKNSRTPENHIWSYAYLDNRYVFIDVTWGSPLFADEATLRKYGVSSKYFCDFSYFDVPIDVFRREHHWSIEDYGF